MIVNVNSVQGPHERGEVQRSARNNWGRIVSCYKSLGRRKSGSFQLSLTISPAGKVTTARHTGGTFKNAELGACLVDVMKRAEMPSAGARSTALTEIELAPGDAS